MLPPARVVAIDDKEPDLLAIADALNDSGVATLKFLFDGGLPEGARLQGVRVIFIYLHLSDPGLSKSDTPHFSIIGGLLAEHIIESNGPFILILWTEYPNRAEALAAFLFERLADKPHAIPVAVASLDKAEHFKDGRIADSKKLIKEIIYTLRSNPPVAALVGWESRIVDAAAETISGLIDLVPAEKRYGEHLGKELGRLLNALATEAVGPGNVGKDRLAAVNEALLPILYDTVARISSKQSQDIKIWKKAIPAAGSDSDLSEQESAKLNGMLHFDFVASNSRCTDRGAVFALAPGEVAGVEFRKRFGMEPKEVAKWQFGVVLDDRCVWLLVQVEGICDYAQSQAGLNPFVLALECSAKSAISDREKPDAAWDSPVFYLQDEVRKLIVNFRYGLSFTDDAIKDRESRYRLREALINDLTARMHSYGARPGIISFKEKTQIESDGSGSKAAAAAVQADAEPEHRPAAQGPVQIAAEPEQRPAAEGPDQATEPGPESP